MNLRRFNLVLLVLGLALGATLAVLLTRGSEALPGQTEAEQRSQLYVDVSRAATAQVQAFLGIDHDNVDAQAQTVLDGSTGDFKEQYAAEVDNIKESAREQESTAVPSVLEVGISDVDTSTATVFVAANTQVTSKATKGETKTVPWRIQLDMEKVDGRWLTSGLQFVG